MKTKKLYHCQIALFLLPLSVLVVAILLAKSQFLHGNTDSNSADIALGVTLDLTLTLPLLYFLAIRKTRVPKITLIPVFVFGLVLAKFLLPNDHHSIADFIQAFVLPMVEFVVVSFIGYKVYTIRKAFKAAQERKIDFYEAFLGAAVEVTKNKKLSHFLTTEIAAIGYAFFIWKKPARAENEFTIYKDSANLAIFGAVILAIVAEGFAIHFWIERYSPVAAWILSIASAYFLIQILGHIKAIKRRYVSIEEDKIIYRYGIFGRVEIPKDLIEKIEVSNFDFKIPEGRKIQRVNLLNEVEGANIAFYLKEEIEVEKIYGIKKVGDVLVLHVDDAKRFQSECNPT
ncbi:MAG: hypothetical protein MK078_02785 [Crocinitomicaceae bacterium]|nr:hypothetical protein [Crocinitomicaceae bacterium]